MRTPFWCMKEPWFEVRGIGAGSGPDRSSVRPPRSAKRLAHRRTVHKQQKESTVAKGMEQKKETKKKPAKTMKEKKAEKNAKKASK